MLKKAILRYLDRHPKASLFLRAFASNRMIYNNRLMQKYMLNKACKYDKTYLANNSIFIETVLTCNAKCIMCKHGYENMTGVMDAQLYENIIDQCHAAGINCVGLHNYGEPLIDKHFIDRVKYLRNYGMTYSIATNGSLLTEEKAINMLELGGISHINFSLHAINDDTYHKVTGLNKEITYSNVNRFIELVESGKYEKPGLISVSFVNLKLNRKERSQFVKYWQAKKSVGQIMVGDLFDRIGNNDIEEIGSLKRMHSGRENKWMPPCKAIWGNLHVYYDGRVAPCCDDGDERELIIGDFNVETLDEIKNGAKLRALKDTHLNDKRHKQKVCKDCSHIYPIF